jgi:hypothetical protein
MIAPLAYKYVALAAMLAEINYCAARLHLPVEVPVRERDIRQEFIPSPSVIGFGGRLDTEKYSFCFAMSGRLRFIVLLDDGRGTLSLREYQESLARKKSKISTQEAYRIATNWLCALDVDVKRLEKGHRPISTQQFTRSWESETNADLALPLFDVVWGDRLHPLIDIEISGVNGELMKLRQEDDSYSRRPAELITNMDKLLSISDQEFLKYTPEQRSNLVAQFAAVKYPPLVKPSPDTNNSNTGKNSVAATNTPPSSMKGSVLEK